MATDLAAEAVSDSHFHPLDLSDVTAITHKVLHGASCEIFLPLGQVQPQPVCLQVVGPDDDDIDSGSGAGITVHPRGQCEVVGDDWAEEENLLIMGFYLTFWELLPYLNVKFSLEV